MSWQRDTCERTDKIFLEFLSLFQMSSNTLVIWSGIGLLTGTLCIPILLSALKTYTPMFKDQLQFVIVSDSNVLNIFQTVINSIQIALVAVTAFSVPRMIRNTMRRTIPQHTFKLVSLTEILASLTAPKADMAYMKHFGIFGFTGRRCMILLAVGFAAEAYRAVLPLFSSSTPSWSLWGCSTWNLFYPDLWEFSYNPNVQSFTAPDGTARYNFYPNEFSYRMPHDNCQMLGFPFDNGTMTMTTYSTNGKPLDNSYSVGPVPLIKLTIDPNFNYSFIPASPSDNTVYGPYVLNSGQDASQLFFTDLTYDLSTCMLNSYAWNACPLNNSIAFTLVQRLPTINPSYNNTLWPYDQNPNGLNFAYQLKGKFVFTALNGYYKNDTGPQRFESTRNTSLESTEMFRRARMAFLGHLMHNLNSTFQWTQIRSLTYQNSIIWSYRFYNRTDLVNELVQNIALATASWYSGASGTYTMVSIPSCFGKTQNNFIFGPAHLGIIVVIGIWYLVLVVNLGTAVYTSIQARYQIGGSGLSLINWITSDFTGLLHLVCPEYRDGIARDEEPVIKIQLSGNEMSSSIHLNKTALKNGKSKSEQYV